MGAVAGICNLNKGKLIAEDVLKKMLAIVSHRGPDTSEYYTDYNIGMGCCCLSINKNSNGQPIHNENESLWALFDGKIFNYMELRNELLAKGHQFYTKSDVEVIIHLYEEYGPDFLAQLNGQFALIIWDKIKNSLFLARDRIGICPLFYTQISGQFMFASQIKSLFAHKLVKRELDCVGLQQIYTFWANIAPRTVFKDIFELPPAHYMIVSQGNTSVKKYWDFEFVKTNLSENDCADKFLYLLKNSIELRMQADVPVATYLSGGIDSALISALAKKFYSKDLQTFSAIFDDPKYDESGYQRQMQELLKTHHNHVPCSYADIGRVMPELIWHAEKPLNRITSGLLFALSGLVRKNNVKVVLSGEGADEILGGYFIFREAKIRRFWARFPNSKFRPLLIRKLWSNTHNWSNKTAGFLEGSYRKLLLPTDPLQYSHLPRWESTRKVTSYFSQDVKHNNVSYDPIAEFDSMLPESFPTWEPLARAQYIEAKTFLQGYLISSQADRMLAANSVEGRFPFLDNRLVEFAFNLPSKFKLKVLQEKYLLKLVSREFLPAEIIARVRQPYRSSDSACFLGEQSPAYVEELLSPGNLKETGYFDPVAVAALIKKTRDMDASLISARDNLAIVSIITTLLLDKMYIKEFSS